MKDYPKIQTVYKRDMEAPGRKKPLIEGEWTKPEFFYLKDNLWDCFEKVDGTNVRVIWDIDDIEVDHKLTFKGRHENSQMPPHLLDKLQTIFTRDKMFEVFEKNPVCMYGEGYGWKIQKGGMDYFNGEKECGFILFDIKIGRWWLMRDALEDIAKQFNIPIVPIVKTCTLEKAIDMCKYGFTSHLRLSPPEGLVCKPTVHLANRKGERVITKLKLEDFMAR
jgi:hypothetical protein